MFNLNIPPQSLLNIDGSGLCSTPKTPEIVNSLIAMTNPMDNYNFNAAATSAVSTPGSAASLRNFNGSSNAQSISQDSSHSSCSASPLDSPAGTNTTPSVQQATHSAYSNGRLHASASAVAVFCSPFTNGGDICASYSTCSQLIKAGLKLSIQSKRKLSTCDSSSGSEQPNSKCSRRDDDCDSSDDDSETKTTPKGLTPEDEDRRRRRRERNKIAATKCRMKKRERTQNLIKESEQLDTQNVDLKNQVRALETERRKLLEMLQAHSSNCLGRDGFSLPGKLLQSPAAKYLSQLQLDDNSNCSNNNNNSNSGSSNNGSPIQSNGNHQQRTVIPPMSTIKFSRSNGFKAAAAANGLNAMPMNQQIHSGNTLHQQLPNGYCKPSPTPQELGYLNSPSQDNLCLSALQSHHTTNSTVPTTSAVSHQLSDYIPNCDNLGLVSTPTSVVDTSTLLGVVTSPLNVISTSTTATEFVKNELVDSQSPYTTAQSAERFLFESNCDSFVDIKHHVSLQSDSHNNNSITHNNNNLLDFHSTLIGSANSIGPFHDQISIKNDYMHEADLLAQLTGEAAEFVDLDTGVAAAFMANGGCLA